MTDEEIKKWAERNELERTAERTWLDTLSVGFQTPQQKGMATRKWNAAIRKTEELAGVHTKKASTGTRYLTINDKIIRFSNHEPGVNWETVDIDIRRQLDGSTTRQFVRHSVPITPAEIVDAAWNE